MIQAATERVVDFREAKPFDRKWLLKLRWLLQDLERRNFARFETIRMQRELAAMAVPNTDVDRCWKASAKHVRQVASCLFPWIGDAKAQMKQAVDELRQSWIRHWGDPGDPEVAARIEKTIAELKAR